MNNLFDDGLTPVGLVLGKFMPFHVGHEGLISFARRRSDRLIVLVGATRDEPIPGPVRFNWLRKRYNQHLNSVEVHYTDHDFPQAQESNREVSQYWANWLKMMFPDVTCIFSSEPYGEYVAEYMGIKHCMYDQPREAFQVSGTMVRENPLTHWNKLTHVAQPYFMKKICLYGPESVGKSTMAIALAKHFGTSYVPEVARDMMDTTYTCVFEDMEKIAIAQAQEMQRRANWMSTSRFLFCDSDLLTTEIYSEYLFRKLPEVPEWVRKENRYDLCLFLDNNVPYVQDGTRLGEHTQEGLRNIFLTRGLAESRPTHLIDGTTFEERFQQCVQAVQTVFNYDHDQVSTRLQSVS